LQIDQPVVISAVSGMGGIGKSELALQYAYKHQTATYPGGICWLKAREDLGLQIVDSARIYANLELPTDWELIEKVKWCWKQWRNATTLIVFDDVQSYGDIQPFLPPPQSQFRVLLTSRSKFPAPIQDCEIKVLSEARSIELLGSFSEAVKSSIDADLATAKEICKWLGYLPLGLELVGRYLANDEDLSVAEVWQNLNDEKLMAQALRTAEAGMTAELGIIAAFELSWQKLMPEDQELAARLSLFALAEIPWSLVEQCLFEWQPQQLKDRRQILLRSSLLTRTRQGMYELHQLLREFFALKLQAMSERGAFTTQFAQALTEVAKTIDEVVTIHQQNILTPFLSHLAAATDFTQYLAEANNDKSWCCIGLAGFYQTQSQFSKAEKWRKKSLDICENQLGENHLYTSISLDNLGGLYKSMGRYNEAESLCLRALAIREGQLDKNHPYIAGSLNSLVELYGLMERYREAEPLCLRALAIREDRLGKDHPETGTSLNNLGALYYSMGRYEEAVLLFIRSLPIIEYQLGENHPYTADTLGNLAASYTLIGQHAKAEELYVRALDINENQLGADHPATKITRECLQILRQQ
jgi:tetratricopeptide (TPR) repeat protein